MARGVELSQHPDATEPCVLDHVLHVLRGVDVRDGVVGALGVEYGPSGPGGWQCAAWPWPSLCLAPTFLVSCGKVRLS